MASALDGKRLVCVSRASACMIMVLLRARLPFNAHPGPPEALMCRRPMRGLFFGMHQRLFVLSSTSLAYYDDKGGEKGRVSLADMLEMSISNKKKHCLKFTCKVVDATGVQHKNRTYECQVL